MQIKKRFSNQRGSTMLIVIVAVSIIIIGVYAVTEYMSRLYRQEHTTHTRRRIAVLQQSIMSLIKSKVSWDATTLAPANAAVGFSCLANGGCSLIPVDFSFYQTSTSRLSDPANPSAGLNLNGDPCTTFSLTEPDANCPVRYDFKWVVDCSSCLFKAPRIIAQLSVSHPNIFPINVNYFKIDTIRGKEAGTVAETCKSMKGIFNATTGKCELPFAGVPCGTASSMNGILDNGEVNCFKSPAFGLQPCLHANEKPMGINSKGEVLCAAR